MPRPERILLLRSGRHLEVALTALARAYPGCEVAVVGTPGSEIAIAEAGVPAARTFVLRRRRFSPARVLLSPTAIAVWRWGFDRVAVLWNDPDGTGQGNVDRTAFALSPAGFLAVTPDGRMTPRGVTPQVRHELRRALTSVAAAIVLGALYLPALVLPARRS